MYCKVQQAVVEQDDLELDLDADELAALSRTVSRTASKRSGGRGSRSHSSRALMPLHGDVEEGQDGGAAHGGSGGQDVGGAAMVQLTAATGKDNDAARYIHLDGSDHGGSDGVAPSVEGTTRDK